MGSMTFPNMSTVLPAWYENLTFGIVSKAVDNYVVVETETDIDFFGVWQPFSTRDLLLKPEGERSWSWFWCHSRTDLKLKNDDVIKFEGIQYRVMAQNDYTLNGYMEYHLIEDFTQSGPAVNP